MPELLRKILYEQYEPQSQKAKAAAYLVKAWAHVVAMVSEYNIGMVSILCIGRPFAHANGSQSLIDFVLRGQNAVFQHRRGQNTANILWPLFMGEVLRHKSLNEFNKV